MQRFSPQHQLTFKIVGVCVWGLLLVIITPLYLCQYDYFKYGADNKVLMVLQRIALFLTILVRMIWISIDPLEQRDIIPPALNGLLYALGTVFVDSAWGLNLLRYAQSLWKLGNKARGYAYWMKLALVGLLIGDLVVQVGFNIYIYVLFENPTKRESISAIYYYLSAIEVLGYGICGGVVMYGILKRIPKNFTSNTTKFIIVKVRAFIFLGLTFITLYSVDLLVGVTVRGYRKHWWKSVITLSIEWGFCATIMILTCWRQSLTKHNSSDTSSTTYGSVKWPVEVSLIQTADEEPTAIQPEEKETIALRHQLPE